MENKREELKGILRELIDEDTAKNALAAKDAAYEKLMAENKSLREAEEARKASVGKVISLNTPEGKAVDFIYKGYDLRNQCRDIRIKDESLKESIAKFTVDMIQKAALTEGNTGAYLVPDEYENTVMSLARLESVALNKCRMFNISRDVLKIPIESAKTTVDAQAFGTANSESEPTLSQITLNMVRIGNYSEVYNDLLEDSVFDITSWLMSLNAEAIGQTIDSNVLGAGTGFTGNCLADAYYTGTVGTSASTIANTSFTHISELISKLSSNKLAGAEFYFNKSLAHYLRVETDDEGRPIWTQTTMAVPSQLYGYNANLVEAMVAAPATTARFVLFGNLQNYALAIRKGMTMQINPYIKMKEGITQMICHTRIDGETMQPTAFSALKIG